MQSWEYLLSATNTISELNIASGLFESGSPRFERFTWALYYKKWPPASRWPLLLWINLSKYDAVFLLRRRDK